MTRLGMKTRAALNACPPGQQLQLAMQGPGKDLLMVGAQQQDTVHACMAACFSAYCLLGLSLSS